MGGCCGTGAGDAAGDEAGTSTPVGGAAPAVDVGAATFTIPGAGFAALYRDNAALTREFAVRVRAAGSPANVSEFLVQSGQFNHHIPFGQFALVEAALHATETDVREVADPLEVGNHNAPCVHIGIGENGHAAPA